MLNKERARLASFSYVRLRTGQRVCTALSMMNHNKMSQQLHNAGVGPLQGQL